MVLQSPGSGLRMSGLGFRVLRFRVWDVFGAPSALFHSLVLVRTVLSSVRGFVKST